MQKKHLFSSLLPLFAGISAFFLVVGHRVLIPTNIAWLIDGDPSTSYLGWLFFRNGDWTFPLGLNPDYGLEIGNAIVYSDSNPLLAIFFKAFSSFLPEPFQYFGIWLLACFILQAWFGWKLAGLMTNNPFIRALISGFFVFSPAMFLRLTSHFSLVGHFLILAALYLTLRKNSTPRLLPWSLLMIVTTIIHAYFLAMVFLLWLADLADRTRNKEITSSMVRLEILLIGIFTAFTLWQAGYFTVAHGLASEGFGFFRMNLLSIIDSDSWSFILKSIPNANTGEYEGYNYLGLGSILLLIFALCSLLICSADIVTASIKKHLWLFSTLLLLTLFALSNVIAIGSVELILYIPPTLQKALNIFRASGRMFWPVYYMILFASIYIVINSYKKRYVAPILILTLIAQIADTSPGWLTYKKRLITEPSSTWKSPLTHPFWDDAATTYKKLKIVPPGNVSPDWQELATYAGIHGMATNAVYLARIDRKVLENEKKSLENAFLQNKYDPETLYIFQDNSSERDLTTEDNLFTVIQGFTVFAPGWKNTFAGKKEIYAKLDIPAEQVKNTPKLMSREKLLFSNGSKGISCLKTGWANAEEWGVWSSDSYAELILSVPPTAQGFVIDANCFIDKHLPKQYIEVLINRISVARVHLTTYYDNSIDVRLPETIKNQLLTTGSLKVSFVLPDAARPLEINGTQDTRKIALGLKSITIY